MKKVIKKILMFLFVIGIAFALSAPVSAHQEKKAKKKSADCASVKNKKKKAACKACFTKAKKAKKKVHYHPFGKKKGKKCH